MPKSLLSPEVKACLDEAVHAELYAANLYKHLANQLQRLGYFGAQRLFLAESASELEHYQIHANYQNDSGTVASIPAIDAMDEPIGTLRDALSYPQTGDTYAAERYEQVLRTCRLEHLIPKLDEVNHWQRLLSGGEQQRLAFARILLYRPQWLYMDESTSAMDEEDEAMLYQALIDQLPGLSIVSVGHRSSLARFHPRHVRIQDGQLIAR